MPRLSLHASQKMKNTPAGHLPVNWGFAHLETVAEIQTGLSKSQNREGATVSMPYLRVANVQDGHFDLNDIKTIDVPAEALSRYLVHSGDVILTEGGDFDKLGRGAVWRGQIAPCVHQNHLFVVRPDAQRLDPCFLAYQTQGSLGRNYFRSCSKQSTNLASVNSSQLKRFPVPLPSLPEQQKIADILGTWDEALEKLDALIAAKDRRKQAFAQQLMSGGRTEKKWPRVSLSEAAEACSIRNGDKLDRTRLYAVTKAEGMVPMRENVQGATINRCQIVERGWFAYNPMRINIGSIARWEHDDPVMVSPDYVVFKTDETRLLSDYLNHVRRGIAWSDFVGAAGNGSVRVRIWFEDLGCFKFPLPSIPEQRAIANILDAADSELRLLRQQRTAIDHQKRGLMQQLLTGRVRVRT
jgi:type I restriction enzyme S subunit